MSTYITLAQAKSALRIDPGLTVDDQYITDLIGAAEDWAENFTNRSLAQLMQFTNSPTDSGVSPAPEPIDSPAGDAGWVDPAGLDWGGGFDWTLGISSWSAEQLIWANSVNSNPVQSDASVTSRQRRDVHAAILLYLTTLYDQDVATIELLEQRATDMLWPYRIGLGV